MEIPSLARLRKMDVIDALGCLDEAIENVKDEIRMCKNGNKRCYFRYLFEILVIQDEYLSIQNMDE